MNLNQATTAKRVPELSQKINEVHSMLDELEKALRTRLEPLLQELMTPSSFPSERASAPTDPEPMRSEYCGRLHSACNRVSNMIELLNRSDL